MGTPRIPIYGALFHEGGGPYLKGEKPPTLSSISNTGLIDGVPPLSANGPLRFIRIIYMGQAHKSNRKVLDLHMQHFFSILYTVYFKLVNHTLQGWLHGEL